VKGCRSSLYKEIDSLRKAVVAPFHLTRREPLHRPHHAPVRCDSRAATRDGTSPGVSLAPSEAAERRTAAVVVDRSGFTATAVALRAEAPSRPCILSLCSINCVGILPEFVDLVVVAAQIKGSVDNREEKNREYRDADRLMRASLPRYAANALKPSEAQARTIGANASRRDGKARRVFLSLDQPESPCAAAV